ncbi:MAG: glycosyltransferase [Bryobacteraceae bacterium]|nr:glycosyltransferase [Bryobacteraceae bacterium]
MSRLFKSFLMGGFECSTHRLRNGKRLDLLASTGHDRFAAQDYRALREFGVQTVRDGIRWHLIDRGGALDFSSVIPMLEAAEETGTEALWDIFHFGWPDDIDPYSAEFVRRYARLAREFARVLLDHTSRTPFIAPCNEISFLSWAGGDVAYLNPYSKGRGWEFKIQLARAALAAIEEIRGVSSAIRLVYPEPVIHLAGRPDVPGDDAEAEGYRLLQYQAWDMIAGRLEPSLGGREEYLEILGLNFYDRNQWVNHGDTLKRGDSRYKPFSQMIAEVWERYRRPLLVAETGVEDDQRPAWLAYIAAECRRARRQGIPVEGLCWYPIANHLGWEDDRRCHNGLLGFADDKGVRRPYEPLAAEWRRQLRMFDDEQDGGANPAPENGRAGAGGVSESGGPSSPPDILCMSHLRWNFVFQRPQHLMSRFARQARVFFFEEPVFDEPAPRLDVRRCPSSGVWIATPMLPAGLPQVEAERMQARLLKDLLSSHDVRRFRFWFYSPMALPLTTGLEPELVIYDCMDELSLFHGAPAELLNRESLLLTRADVVFTGGHSLYEAKRSRHPNVYAFPSSVDARHFALARNGVTPPADQEAIPRPRLGFCGVIDERLDTPLLRAAAERRPDWQFVMLGPVVKIDPEALPRAANIHYLGGRPYQELPAYFAGWDAAIMPFARNDATRFISPTKTPEYLAAGLPVVSTSIRDVVRGYAGGGYVRIADDPAEFIAAAEAAMNADRKDPGRLERVDALLRGMSWDVTWRQMKIAMEAAAERRTARSAASEPFAALREQYA